MSARKRKPRPPARAARGELRDFSPLIAADLDLSYAGGSTESDETDDAA